jgi:cysteine desulfurase
MSKSVSSHHADDDNDNDDEFNEQTCVYLDYNATTPVDPWVMSGMMKYFTTKFGNPSSSHVFGTSQWFVVTNVSIPFVLNVFQKGREAKEAVAEARGSIVKLLGASENSEIVFTSCGSESNNLAICGVVLRQPANKRHIVTSAIEHPAVSEVVAFLEREHGARVTVVPVDRQGFVNVDEVKRAFADDTCLCTIILANNEVGTIQPIAEIGSFARSRGVLMHTDAAQAVGKIPVDVDQLSVDLLTIVGHKMYAPKGIGALYVRKGVQLSRVTILCESRLISSFR